MAQVNSESIRKTYREYENHQLVRMTITAAADLTSIAREVLKAELSERGLVPALWPTIDVPVQRFSDHQLDVVIARLQTMPCPLCGERKTSLNGYLSSEPSWLNLVGLKKIATFNIGCQPCLASKGVRRFFKLKPGQRWRPDEALKKFVFRHAAQFVHFEPNAEATPALLRRDYPGFLVAVGAARPGEPVLE